MALAWFILLMLVMTLIALAPPLVIFLAFMGVLLACSV
jgi:hypothetical protein